VRPKSSAAEESGLAKECEDELHMSKRRFGMVYRRGTWRDGQGQLLEWDERKPLRKQVRTALGESSRESRTAGSHACI
jgi:hypothetical protein